MNKQAFKYTVVQKHSHSDYATSFSSDGGEWCSRQDYWQCYMVGNEPCPQLLICGPSQNHTNDLQDCRDFVAHPYTSTWGRKHTTYSVHWPIWSASILSSSVCEHSALVGAGNRIKPQVTIRIAQILTENINAIFILHYN